MFDCITLTDAIDVEDQVTRGRAQDAHAVALLQLVEVGPVVLAERAAIEENGVAGHDPGAATKLSGRGWKDVSHRRIHSSHTNFDAAGPFRDNSG